MSIVLALIAVLCFVCAIGMLFWGLGTGNEFNYKAERKDDDEDGKEI